MLENYEVLSFSVPTDLCEIKLEKTGENKCKLKYDTRHFIKIDTLFLADKITLQAPLTKSMKSSFLLFK